MSTDFSTFGLRPELMKALEKMKFEAPTPIQEEAIPFGLEGRDILGSAQTGTGKTGAFGVPLISKLLDEPESCALIVTPTRELATQVMSFIKQLASFTKLQTALLIGGEPIPKQLRQLRNNPRLIVGTPGRINDHLSHKKVDLSRVSFLVLDETDRMLDMGFGVQIDEILSYMPQERQTMLFSATLPKAIVKLSQKYLQNPQRIQIGSSISVAENIQQEEIRLPNDKKFEELLKIISGTNTSVIIFVKTKFGAEKLAKRLKQKDLLVEALHGDMRQTRRTRVVDDFRNMKFQILVATDIAARGLDIPHVDTVINHDLPQCPEDFIHRIGRTARAGAHGQAISFISESDEKNWLAIFRLMNPDAKPPEGFKKKGGKKRSPKKDGKRKTYKPSSERKKVKEPKEGGEKKATSRRPFKDKDDTGKSKKFSKAGRAEKKSEGSKEFRKPKRTDKKGAETSKDFRKPKRTERKTSETSKDFRKPKAGKKTRTDKAQKPFNKKAGPTASPKAKAPKKFDKPKRSRPMGKKAAPKGKRA